MADLFDPARYATSELDADGKGERVSGKSLMKDRKTWTDHASLGELARVWLKKSIFDTSHG